MIKDINLENLVKWDSGVSKGKINWSKSIGSTCKFKYGEIEGVLTIRFFNKNNRRLIVEYNDKEFEILNTSLVSCKIGEIVNPTKTLIETHLDLVNELGIPYEIASKYSYGSGKKVSFKCKYCENEINGIIIENMIKRRSIGCRCCGDGISYPEKLIYNVLKNLDIEFMTQLSKSTFDWCGNYKYDFYIPSLNCIIETHGMQHYKDTNWGKCEVVKSNDKDKKEIAKNNNIKNYVVIDCRYSELEYIKKSIINSSFNNIVDLSHIDWNKCDEESVKNLVKLCCDIKISNPHMTTSDISIIVGVSGQAVRRWLIKGSDIGYYNYDSKNENKLKLAKAIKTIKDKSMKVEIYDEYNVFIDEFESINSLEKCSLDRFGVYLAKTSIRRSCDSGKLYKGFYFKLIK